MNTNKLAQELKEFKEKLNEGKDAFNKITDDSIAETASYLDIFGEEEAKAEEILCLCEEICRLMN